MGPGEDRGMRCKRVRQRVRSLTQSGKATSRPRGSARKFKPVLRGFASREQRQGKNRQRAEGRGLREQGGERHQLPIGSSGGGKTRPGRVAYPEERTTAKRASKGEAARRKRLSGVQARHCVPHCAARPAALYVSLILIHCRHGPKTARIPPTKGRQGIGVREI